MRIGFVLLAVLSVSCGAPPQDSAADPRPDLLLLVSDDQGVVLGCYGAEGVQTPELDRIAKGGRRFTRAYAPSAVCTPSRSSIYTGLMPARHGANGFGPISDGVPVWGEFLGGLGYRTGLIGKVGAKPLRRFPFVFLSRSGREDEGARSLQWHVDQLDAFLAEDDGRPWALVVNFRDSHWPFPTDGAPFGEGSPPPHDPAAVDVPGALLDTPAVRAELARFHDGLRRMDATVGAMLDRLSSEEGNDKMVGFFTSDNGPPFPFAKTTLYEAGIRMPLLAFGAGVEPGDDDHLVSLTDLLPTFLDLAGSGIVPGAFDGRSLVPLLEGEDPEGWRTCIFGTHDAHRVEPAVPSRSVRFGDWKYIRTWGEALRFENAVMLTSDTWPEMVRAAADDPALAGRVQRLQFRPTEELYDLARDPEELVNLAAAPAAAEALAEGRRLAAESDLISDPGR